MNDLVKVRLDEIVKNEEKVSLDEVWKWVGYKSKQMAIKRLVQELEDGEEYMFNQTIKQVSHQGGIRNQPIKDYLMTYDSFKVFAASAHTDKGKETRRYLVAAEKELRELKLDDSKIDDTGNLDITGDFQLYLNKAFNALEKKLTDKIIKASLLTLKESRKNKSLPELDSRAEVVSIVNNYSHDNKIQHSAVYYKLYGYFMNQVHYNPSIQAKKNNMNVLEYIESVDDIDLLLVVAKQILI